MKSLKRRFQISCEKNPHWSSYISFGVAITKQNFSRKTIHYWFNRLVEKGDYAKAEKLEILLYLEGL